jgi:hypothetical protein
MAQQPAGQDPEVYMPRGFGTTATGDDFVDDVVEVVWSKGKPEPPHPLTVHRRDMCGAPIQRYSYGTETLYGWEIDHIKPVSQGGTDDLENLQPLQWVNNRNKSDNWPRWQCKRTS